MSGRRRVGRLERTASPKAEPTPAEDVRSATVGGGNALPPADADAALQADAEVLGRKMAAEYEGMVRFYQQVYELSRTDAKARLDGPAVAEAASNAVDRVLKGNPDQLSWLDLSAATRDDPQLAACLWGHLKDVAHGEFASGHRAAKVVAQGMDYGPYDRARFLAIREGLANEWGPVSPTEGMLVDMLAQLHCTWEMWVGRMVGELTFGLTPWRKAEREIQQEYGGIMPVHLSDAASFELSGQMVERMQRMILRTVRALRDLRRYAPTVVVNQAGQVNIGEKQINVSDRSEQRCSEDGRSTG